MVDSPTRMLVRPRVDSQWNSQRWTSQVGVHQQHALAGLGEDHGEIGRRRTLALTRTGTGHEEPAGRLIQQREVDVGP